MCPMGWLNMSHGVAQCSPHMGYFEPLKDLLKVEVITTIFSKL